MPATRSHAEWDRPLVAICFGGLAARLLLAWWMPNVGHGDETFQYLEQAYRIVEGRGLVPWEYVVGARSWLIPGALIPIFAAAHAVSASPAVALWAVTVVASLLSLLIVIGAFELGQRNAGRLAGLYAALLTAFWCEIVYFSSHVLADTLSAVPLMLALAIGYRREARGGLIWTGALLALAVVLRPARCG